MALELLPECSVQNLSNFVPIHFININADKGNVQMLCYGLVEIWT